MMQRLFLEYVTRYFGGVIIKAGFSEEEVLGLPLRYTSPFQILTTTLPPHPRPIWRSASLHQFYVHMAMGP